MFSLSKSLLNSPIDLSIIEESSGKPKPSIKSLDSTMIKKFQPGSVYNPFDFSMARLHLDKKYSKKNSSSDIFDQLQINPLDLYTNPEFLSRFISSTGKILHRDITGLSAKNQFRLSKSIRRCQAIGLMSKTHKDISLLPSRIVSKN